MLAVFADDILVLEDGKLQDMGRQDLAPSIALPDPSQTQSQGGDRQ